jgi:methionyl-tRNA formyltransferase
LPLRIIFMGTPAYAVPTLQALHDAGHEIVAVYSQPPRPAGRRGLELKPSPVHEAAERLGIPVFTPKSLKSEEEQAAFKALEADAAVVVAYGLLCPKRCLMRRAWGPGTVMPRCCRAGVVRLRSQRAIMAGDTETGVMIMQMDVGLDTGPVALTQTVGISASMTADELHDILAGLTADMITDAMARLERGELPVRPQPGQGVSYAAKISKEETRVDFTRPALDVHNHVRGLAPAPGAWFELQTGDRAERVKLLASEVVTGGALDKAPGTVLDDQLTIACGEGAVRFLRLQKAGGNPLSAQDFLRGTPVAPGTVIS